MFQCMTGIRLAFLEVGEKSPEISEESGDLDKNVVRGSSSKSLSNVLGGEDRKIS